MSVKYIVRPTGTRDEQRARRRRCDECGKEWADWPARLCSGCEAYREHTQ